MNKYILFAKKTYVDQLMVVKEYSSQSSAEEAGNFAYTKLILDTIIVAGAWFDHVLNKVCYSVVYKRVRVCKHPNAQGDLFEGVVCNDCKLILKALPPLAISSTIETIIQEEEEEDEDEDEDEVGLIEITEQYNLQTGRVGK